MSSGLSRRGFLGGAARAGLGLGLGLGLPTVVGSTLSPSAAAATRSPQQALSDLVDLRFGMFNHFNMGTFTDEEWATPGQDPKRFAPTRVDCAQWAAAAKAAGMRFGVLTTKHHDGFCLWPSAQTSYTVANSSYPQDVVGQYVTAFRDAGLRVGLYFSIWDRNDGVQAYGGHVNDTTQAIRPSDLTFVLAQITELLTGYGTIDMFVTDGYAWQMGQQALSYQRIREHVKSLQPGIVLVDHGGLSQPFLGDAIYFEEPLGITSPTGNTYASLQGQTISDGWFWHPSTPTADPMSKASILSHLADLEPKFTTFILNCPPNRGGVLDANIVSRLTEIGASWTPDVTRPALPPQPLRCEHPITPVSAYATAFHAGEGPLNAIDGFSDKGSETCWSTWSLPLPQSITIDLGGVWSDVSTLEYLPKQWGRAGSTDGDITKATISTSIDGVTFTPVATVSWAPDATTKLVEWTAVNAGFVRITVTAAAGDYANIGGLRIGGRTSIPAPVGITFPVAETPYRIVNRNSGKVVDVSGRASADGSQAIQWPWNGTSHQQWTFTSTGDGYWKVRDRNSGKLLEVSRLSRADGGTVGIWTDTDEPQQHWAVTPTGDGYCLLTNRFSGLALDVAAGATADGAAIDQHVNGTLPRQQWQLIPS